MKFIGVTQHSDTIRIKTDKDPMFDCSKYSSCSKAINKCNKKCSGYSLLQAHGGNKK